MKPILTLLAAALAAAALAIPAAAGDPATDVPRSASSERYVPFVTDFPASAPEVARPGVAVPVGDGFVGLDAAFGAAVGLALGALAAVSLPRLGRRRTISSA